VLLADGRLLTCFRGGRGVRCELVEPMTGARRVVIAEERAELLTGALPLDDGRVLLPNERVLLDPETGVKEPLPPTGRSLGDLRGTAVSGGRAVFRFAHEYDPDPDCYRLLAYLGQERGFVELLAAPPGTCVEDVHDLRDGRLLIARSAPPNKGRPGHSTLDFVLLSLADLSWQQGASLPSRRPITAFRWGDGILALLRDSVRYSASDERGEAVLLDLAAGSPRPVALPKSGLKLRAYRLAGDELVLFDERGALLWDPARGSLRPVPLPAPYTSDRQIVEHDGELLLFDHANARAYLLSRTLPPRQTPCDDVFAFAEAVMARKEPSEFDTEQFDGLFSVAERRACRDYLARERRFPPPLQAPFDALLRRDRGGASQDETVAASLFCHLVPNWGGTALIAKVRARVDFAATDVCRRGAELLPVLDAAGTPRASRALVEAALRSGAEGVEVQSWVVPLLRQHDELANAAGPLLLEAKARQASGFDALRASLCEPVPRGPLAQSCAQSKPLEEQGWKRSGEVRTKLICLGIATAVVGGLGTLAYVDRDGDGGRAIAIGSGIVGGGALGFGLTKAAAAGGGIPAAALFMLVAVPATVLGSVAGGLVATKASEQPGAARFATAAVPLSALWLTGVSLTVANW
jgi:hypothetical protein